jgi:hypothetical protein
MVAAGAARIVVQGSDNLQVIQMIQNYSGGATIPALNQYQILRVPDDISTTNAATLIAGGFAVLYTGN